MNLVSQVAYAILAMVVAGSLAFAVWQRSCCFSIRSHPRLPYLLLRIVCLLYLLPIAYICMQIGLRGGYVRIAGVWQMKFALTGAMRGLAVVVVAGWFLLTGRQIYVCLFSYHKRRKRKHILIPEEDERVLTELARIKKKLGLRRTVDVYRSSSVFSPRTYGVFRCVIVLPERTYSKEQLIAIFHHELMHCKSFDVFYKLCMEGVGMVGHIGAIRRLIQAELNEWSEYNCDLRAMEAMRDEIGAMRYFEMVLSIMSDETQVGEEEIHFSGLSEKRLRLERRIDYMKRYGNVKQKLNGAAIALAAVFVLTNVTTVYAAGSQVAKVHDVLYRSMEPKVEEGNKEIDLKEFVIPAAEDHSYERIEYQDTVQETVEDRMSENEIVSFSWTVVPGTRTASKTFHVREGQSISMSVSAVPANTTYWIGIMDPQNSVRYVKGENSLSHSFAVNQSGFYRVFVENIGTSDLTASGSYFIYTP